jgi:hypothetical protein
MVSIELLPSAVPAKQVRAYPAADKFVPKRAFGKVFR